MTIKTRTISRSITIEIDDLVEETRQRYIEKYGDRNHSKSAFVESLIKIGLQTKIKEL